jgi:hypothetical protein
VYGNGQVYANAYSQGGGGDDDDDGTGTVTGNSMVIHATNIQDYGFNIDSVRAIFDVVTFEDIEDIGDELFGYVPYSNGSFSLTLTGTMEKKYLRLMYQDWTSEYALISDKKTKSCYFDEFRAVYRGNGAGFIQCYGVSFVFVDRDVTVKGKTEYGNVYDLTLKKGWNQIYSTYSENLKIFNRTTTKPSGVDFPWTFSRD